jgi:hypothetical protein
VEPATAACVLLELAYKVGAVRLPDGHNAKSFALAQLDRLGNGWLGLAARPRTVFFRLPKREVRLAT